MSGQLETPVRVFIAYSWDSEEHKNWVAKLTVDLRMCGIDARCDRFEVVGGQELTSYMERSIRDAAKVVVVCSETYVIKADELKGGVGYEKTIISGELMRELGTTKFVPVMRSNTAGTKPLALSTRLHIDMREDKDYGNALESLVSSLLGNPALTLPTLGTAQARATTAPRASAPAAPPPPPDLSSAFFTQAVADASNGTRMAEAFWELRASASHTTSWPHTSIRSALAASQVHSFGWPVIPILTKPEFAPIPESDSVCSPEELGEFWRVSLRGDIIARMPLFEDSREQLKQTLSIDVQIKRVAEALLRTSLFYEVLALPADTVVSCQLAFLGLKGRTLFRHYPIDWRVAKTNGFVRDVQIMLPLRNPSLTTAVQSVVIPLFGLFNFFEMPNDDVAGVVKTFISELGRFGLPDCLKSPSIQPVTE